MKQKVPHDIFLQLEEKRLLYRIPKDIGFKTEHKKGRSLALDDDNTELLHLAIDTMKFWTSTEATSVDNICLLEKKRVVWKFYDNFARKLVHLFKCEVDSLKNVDIVRNNQLKKNISAVEIWCNYDHFKTVEPKMENICRGVDALKSQQIQVKQSETVKAQQFVTKKLDNDTNVLCLYNAKHKTLDIFAKNEDYILQAIDEFKHGSLKNRESGRKGSTPTATKTTEMHIKASSFTEPRAKITEPKNKHVSSFTETRSVFPSSTKILKQSFITADGNSKDSLPPMSLRSSKTSDSQEPESTGKSTDESAQSPKDVAKTDISASNDASSKMCSQGLFVGSGSKFLYEFTHGYLKVSVYPHSIVDVKGVDAIVNAANDVMVHGGGVAYHVSKAAGKEMDDEGTAYVRKYGKLNVADFCLTRAGKLPYKGIIHAVGPQWVDYIGKENRCAADLYLTIKNILETAKQMKYRSIALCAISAGIYGVPKELCAEMYIKALVDFSDEGPGSLSEVHFVDVNLDILGLVKDAHEKWCRSPSSITFENAFKYPRATRRKYVNNTANMQPRSHRQDQRYFSLVNFIGESRTKFDGSPVYEFKICGAVTVKIYTGNLLRTDSVDAIVCSVNDKLQGGFAAAVAKAAGQTYKQDLFNAVRSKRGISEGDVVICNAGSLRVKKVMHIAVFNPVLKVDSQALNRLKHINQKMLQEANLSMIQRIGMPLIGGGLLDRNEELTACSQRFATDVQDFCSINLTKLRIEEIHVVNQDVRRTILLRDAFHNLEKTSTGMESVGDKARSVRGQGENKGSGRDNANVNGRSIRNLWQGQAVGDLQENATESAILDMTRGSTKTRVSAKPLSIKGVQCTKFDTCGHNADWSMDCGHAFCSGCMPQHDGLEQCPECKEEETAGTEAIETTPGDQTNEDDKDDMCPVCLCGVTDPVIMKCSHRICKLCLDQLRKHKPCCPICNTAFGLITGTQPKGTMKHREIPDKLPGFPSCNTIQIIYDFLSGTQGKEHPKPGRPYQGTQRHAYLPNNREGKTVLKLLEVAFKRKLIFTIGDSRTTGKQDRVTWNDIHHKTAKSGGSENYGYPDPDYLDRVREELTVKGVTEDCLK